MIITFISLDEEFINICKENNMNAYKMKIQDYKPTGKKIYFVSPANSLGFMDGGIDLAYSRIMFPGIELKVKNRINELGKVNLLGRKYLPIGSAIIINTQYKNTFLI